MTEWETRRDIKLDATFECRADTPLPEGVERVKDHQAKTESKPAPTTADAKSAGTKE